MKIYVSLSNNVYFNLALENWLFLEQLKDEKILFLWQNAPCVVIGRAQNPWLECNLKAMDKDNIPVVRRQSGGGTVYHDYGNLNYTIISPKDQHDVKSNLDLVCLVVNKLGLNLYPNERNDVVVDHENFTYKVSGSAFREKKDRAFHHGTLLIHTDTTKLYDYLHQPIDNSLDTKGVKSHRSKVLNLSEIISDMQTQDITRSFMRNFDSIELSLIDEETPLHNKELIEKEISTLKSWDWRFGKTLPFTKTYTQDDQELIVEVQAGMIASISLGDTKKDMTSKKKKFEYSYSFDYLKKFV
ncbi:lipoate--protein ligase [Francisella adeliensis]|uniref:Lipoate--protein ligase n=1 Tax=Francisella adeliensis TaxID=2007306 RepID=A0A2Z4XYI6_9GAMM|nr:lipoate--protein ligase [Francisella adeliensis]AXA33849.1 lipoate--protein ligase [Francisella adeliensis]MBK2085750.1 lipoate--protein ligase [Francisella adeliensis]MBK2097628.1 lipoate--protein ligase [Francisella adeliensis]QIW12086.1 lipoate--protein ligase [Francisella adeliensis]QIW13960.1 lipoate--protein ligase [Francisella adeliensis]